MPDATETKLNRKLRGEILVGRYVANPAMRILFKIGITPPFHTLIETIGRKSGATRRLPVAYRRTGDTVWVIAQHGTRAGWVLNLQANPDIRLYIGGTWLNGSAQIMPNDDVRARIATFSDGLIGRRILASTFAALETRPCSIRIDLGLPNPPS
jgi:deazaflavin-dependent oxidoreductase (nitroreductase family)